MVKTITKDIKGNKVPFMFSTRTLAVLSETLGISSIQQFAQRFSDPGFKDICALLYAGHENACFYLKQTPQYNSVDECYEMIDSIGLVEATSLVAEATKSMLGVDESKKKVMKR